MRLVLGLAFASAALLLISTAAAVGDWPEGYVVHENSESPDHQFGLVVPGSDAGEAGEDSGAANYLANLKTHELLGKLADADYFERQNHRHLNVIWSTDSKTCVVEYKGRFGFDTISVLQLKGTSFQQTDLGRHIEKALAAVVGEEGTGSAWFRFAPNNKLLVRALYYTGNPKLIDENSKQARFAGTLDLISKKWSASEAHKTKHWDALSAIYNEPSAVFVTPDGDESKVPENFTGIIVPSEDKRAEALDEDMNEVYKSLRVVLPAARFAKVHEEQVAWLKKRDAAKSVEEKSKSIEERTRALRDLGWFGGG
jgi:lysozyme inhibitor LprI